MSFQHPALPLIFPRSVQWLSRHGLLLAQSYIIIPWICFLLSPFCGRFCKVRCSTPPKLRAPTRNAKTLGKGVIGDHWSNECENTFQKLKRLLVSAPVLGYSDFTKPFDLEIDQNQNKFYWPCLCAHTRNLTLKTGTT